MRRAMTWFIAAACARNGDHTTIAQRLAGAEAVGAWPKFSGCRVGCLKGYRAARRNARFLHATPKLQHAIPLSI
jgi:hypothetical protein